MEIILFAADFYFKFNYVFYPKNKRIKANEFKKHSIKTGFN